MEHIINENIKIKELFTYSKNNINYIFCESSLKENNLAYDALTIMYEESNNSYVVLDSGFNYDKELLIEFIETQIKNRQFIYLEEAKAYFILINARLIRKEQ